MKNIAFIYSGSPVKLNSLEDNRNAMAKIFTSSSLWEEPVNKELSSLSELADDLKPYQNDELNNLFFFYTGHGTKKGQKRDELHVLLEDDKTRNINEIINEIFEVLKYAKSFPKRIAIVLDACYSGALIEENNPFTGSFEILTATTSMQKATEENSKSSLSLFTDAFCEAIEKLAKGSTEVTLEKVSRLIQGSDYSKESGYSYPRTKNGMMNIVEHSQHDLLMNITEDLKQHLNNDEQLLEAYTKNLFEHNSISIPHGFDDIVKYLFEKYREMLIVMLFKLDDTQLNTHIDPLLELQRKKRSDIESFASMKLNMYENRTNLLITLTSKGKGGLSEMSVNILEYKQTGRTGSPLSFIVNLTTSRGKQELITKIRQSIKLNRMDVLLEFILPYELLDAKVGLWKDKNGESLSPRYNMVKRLGLRLEKARIDEVYKSEWHRFWNLFYKKKVDKKLSKVMNHTLRYRSFKQKPYLRLKTKISDEIHKEIVEEGACIVLAPFCSDSGILLDEACQKMSKSKLKNLVNTSFEIFIDTEVEAIPYILIWDNPNRLPTKPAEIKNKQYKSVLGT